MLPVVRTVLAFEDLQVCQGGTRVRTAHPCNLLGMPPPPCTSQPQGLCALSWAGLLSPTKMCQRQLLRWRHSGTLASQAARAVFLTRAYDCDVIM